MFSVLVSGHFMPLMAYAISGIKSAASTMNQ
jgi:hypothetical protein